MKKLLLITILALLTSLYLIFFYAPEEATQGIVQKIFYFHVSSAFCMYFGFGLAGLFSFLYLWKKKEIYDCYAHAGASVGLLFCTMVLMSGPLWAKPIWGTYWTWDPRLTTTLLIWLLFVSVALLRRFYEGDPKGKKAVAILTLFSMADLPLIFLAVKLWRGVHPTVLGEKESMPQEMHITLMATSLSVTLLFILLYTARAKLALLEEKLIDRRIS